LEKCNQCNLVCVKEKNHRNNLEKRLNEIKDTLNELKDLGPSLNIQILENELQIINEVFKSQEEILRKEENNIKLITDIHNFLSKKKDLENYIYYDTKDLIEKEGSLKIYETEITKHNQSIKSFLQIISDQISFNDSIYSKEIFSKIEVFLNSSLII
jgi:hypothetical protein